MQGMLGMISLSEYQGLRNQLEQAIAGENGRDWLEQLKRFNRKESCWVEIQKPKESKPEWGPVTEPRFLMTVTLGRRKNGKEYQKNLKSDGHKLSDWSNDLLVHPKTKFTCATQEEQWDLYVASNSDMGFTRGATRERIYARMYSEELGWNMEKLPAEVGPALREAYTNQPLDEWLLVSMDPLAVSDGGLDLFGVGRGDDGESWLDAGRGNPDNEWDPETLWVVGRRNSFHFSSEGFFGRVCCFCSCPLHPPSIFPISSIGNDNVIYFLLSIDFVSQRIMRSTRRVNDHERTCSYSN